eukprot:SAG31_NODE_1482_length_8175_cov_4.484398_1_plen_132_part_00
MKRASPTAYRSPEAKRCCDPAANITEISGSIIDGKPRVCIGASGSIAAVKTPEIVEKLISAGVHVDLVVTKPADFFMVCCFPAMLSPQTEVGLCYMHTGCRVQGSKATKHAGAIAEATGRRRHAVGTSMAR